MTNESTVVIALKLTGLGFVPETISDLIQLQPTKTWRQGDAVERTQLIRKQDAWILALPQMRSNDLDSAICQLLAVIGPRQEELILAAQEFGLNVEVSMAVYIDEGTPSCLLEAGTIDQLASLGASLDIDLILTD
ncbi:DUF4279 domain-containing protein [Telmatocola sphagniphila]|uniref:DUF4279 domain-containing protein n=1 Tax=Telmatocola sphagniphila TaxID=1123043 RepID=A0A8E6EYZ0_9BACT|nr:DUF4279 domain-containing protein [Telmatocola sphagniphila]QVL33188.1 DUF4279 domain-containing protein [Telmatocola sphagniphila]